MDEHGLILDEHATFISSGYIEGNHEKLEAHLRLHGYRGGRLDSAGKYFSDYGAVYAIYDTDRHTLESAIKFIEEHKKKSA